jgi:hypothetical protein
MEGKGQLIIGSFFDAGAMYRAKKDLKLTKVRDNVSQGYKPTGNNSSGVLMETDNQPIAYYNYPTLNRMVFRDKLWQNMKTDPGIVSRMNAGSLWGETGHKDSLEVMANLISNKVTDFWLSEDKHNLVLGKVQVLDTPEGNIIYSLLKSGDMGISSRGWGDLVAINSGSYPEFVGQSFYDQPDMKVVNEDGYIATCWDFVTVPAVGPAMLSLRQHLDRNPDAKDAVRSSMSTLSKIPDFKYLDGIFRSEPRKIYSIGQAAKPTEPATTRVKPGDTEGQIDEDLESNGAYYEFKRGTFSPTKGKKSGMPMGKNGFDPIDVESMRTRRFRDVSFPHKNPKATTIETKPGKVKKQVPVLQSQDRDRSMTLDRPDEKEQREIFTRFLVHEVARKQELTAGQQGLDDEEGFDMGSDEGMPELNMANAQM